MKENKRIVPTAPMCRVSYDGHGYSNPCPICNSTQVGKYFSEYPFNFGKIKGCLQKQCRNYFKNIIFPKTIVLFNSVDYFETDEKLYDGEYGLHKIYNNERIYKSVDGETICVDDKLNIRYGKYFGKVYGDKVIEIIK